MTCKPDALAKALLAGGLLMLSACAQPEPQLPPLDAARAALARDDGVGAEIVLRRMLDSGTAPDELAAYLGAAEMAQGRLPEARDWLGDGDFSPATRGYGMHMLGVLEMREGDLAAAGRAFDRALAASPDNAALWVDIGRLRYAGGEQTAAIAASKRAVELDGGNSEALLFRGQLIRDADGTEAALPWFEAALEVDPADPDLLADYAATLGELGRAKDMLVAVRKMAEAAPGDPRIYYFQAVLAARAGKFDLARGLLARSDGIEDAMPAAALLGGVIDLQNGNYASAAQTFDRLAGAQPDNRRVRELLVLALRLGGNDRELVYRFADAASEAAASPYLAQQVGRAFEVLGERDRAAALLDRAARPTGTRLFAIGKDSATEPVRPSGSGAMSGAETRATVRRLVATGRGAAAAAVAEGFRARFPGSADALSLAGDANFAAGRYDAAIARYRAAAKIRPTWPLTRRLLAALSAQGSGAAGRLLLSGQLRSEPANREATAMLAVFAFDAGQWESGDALLDHALALGGARDPQLWAMRSAAALEQGRTDDALAAAERAYALQRANPLAIEALRRSLTASGADAAASALAAR